MNTPLKATIYNLQSNNRIRRSVFEGTLSCSFTSEQYHQKLKHSCNFDKKTKIENKFLLIKLYIRLAHGSSCISNLSILIFCQNCNYV